MNTISFGGTGLPATPVGFGGAPFALLGTPASETDTLLGALLDLGVGLLDTAACYGGGDSEEAIGARPQRAPRRVHAGVEVRPPGGRRRTPRHGRRR